MFKLRSFAKQMCQHAAVERSLCASEINIWKFNIFNSLKHSKFLWNIMPCSYALFPYIYWYVLIMSTLGMLLTLYEFITVFHGNNVEPTTFRTRHYRVLPRELRRNARLIGSVVMCKLYIFLVLGVMMMVPELMMPWLTIQAIDLILDFSFWLSDIIFGEETLSFGIFVSYILVAYSWMFVWCIKHTFQQAIINGIQIDKYALF